MMRNEIFWSNNNFMSGGLKCSFALRGESKAGKYILPRQFREVGKYFIISHVGIDFDNVIKTAHNNHLFDIYSAKVQKVIKQSYKQIKFFINQIYKSMKF